MAREISAQCGSLNRRQFLATTGACSVIAGVACAVRASEERTDAAPGKELNGGKPAAQLRLGVLSGTFGKRTISETLDSLKAGGLECLQLSLDSAGLPSMPDEIAPDVIDQIRKEADSRKVWIASLQGTFNMSHPDPAHRREGLRQLRVLGSACQRLGVSFIHICTGTRDPDNMWRRHPDNDSREAWRDMVACVREAVKAAQSFGVTLAFEPEVNNVVDSAVKSRRLLDEVQSPHLKVTIDGANIFHAGELARMGEILDQTFALIGKDIALAHAKDLDHDGDAGHLPAGQGRLDYHRYLSLLVASGYKGPLLLHGLSAAQVPGCAAFLRETLDRVFPSPGAEKVK